MVRIFQIRELEAKKRALAAESEVYRHTLTIEVQNLQLYSFRLRRKIAFFSALGPMLLAAAPLAGSVLRRKKRRASWLRLAATAVFRMGLHNQIIPLVQQFLMRQQQQQPSQPAAAPAPEDEVPAANV